MRELSLQEVNHISGAADTSVDSFVQDGIKWLTGALGGYTSFNALAGTAATAETAANPAFTYVLMGLDVGKWGVAGVGGAAGAVAGYLIGKLLSDYVIKPYA